MALFSIALIPRLAFILLVPYHGPGGDEAGYDHLAWSLAQGKGFVDEAGNPTSFYFPVYPYFVSVIYRLFGHAYLPVFIVQAVLSALLCVMIFAFTRNQFGRNTAALAYIISVFYPSLIFCTQNLLVNCLFAFFFFAIFMTLWKSITTEKAHFFILSGILLGCCVLVRGEALFFLPALGVYAILTKSFKKLFRKNYFLFFCAMIFTLLPWTARNVIVHKTFIPLSTRGGSTLYNSYFISDQGFSYNQFKGVGPEYYKLKTEIEKDRYLMKKAISFITHHPLKALAFAPVKIAHLLYPFDGLWYPVSLFSKYNILWGLVFTFSISGFILLFHKKREIAYLLTAPFFTIVLSSSTFYGKPMYRTPAEPFFIILCSYNIIELSKKKPFLKTFFKNIFPVMTVNLTLFLFADKITICLHNLIKTILSLYPSG